jgi:serine/threonine-protein kinase
VEAAATVPGGGDQAESPEPEPADEPPQERPPPGYLTLDTVPWTTVSRGAQRLGDTPLLRYPLPPGRHELILINSERGLRTTITVQIRSGETTTRRLAVR